ncbi:MAG: HNH endonuclease [Bdellovibrionota bacterium]
MKNFELEMSLAVREERLSTLRVLRLINCAEDERTHLERGFSSLHDWLISAWRYSEGAANRRVQAARMIRIIPDAEEKIVSGVLSLTTLAMVQSFTRGLPVEKKLEIVKSVEGKSGREVEKILAKEFPEKQAQETVSAIDAETSRLSINVPNETIDKLQALRDHMSHGLQTIGEVVARLVAEKRCVIARCSYKDPQTGRICGGTFLPQEDHIHPRALGGSDKPENLRPLCRAHNILVAEHAFGREHMRKFSAQA